MEPEFAIPSVTVEEARRLLETGTRIIDVREQVEWDAGHIRGSELMPLSTVNDWYADLDPGADLLFFCLSGDRSGRVVKALITQAGFTNARNIAGGILAWAEHDLPLTDGGADGG